MAFALDYNPFWASLLFLILILISFFCFLVFVLQQSVFELWWLLRS